MPLNDWICTSFPPAAAYAAEKTLSDIALDIPSQAMRGTVSGIKPTLRGMFGQYEKVWVWH
jgi:hypothetical protein